MIRACPSGGLTDDVPPELARRVVRLAASQRANPEQVRRCVARLLDAGRAVTVEAVVEMLEGLLAARSPLPADRDVDAAVARLREHGARLVVAGAPGYPRQLTDAWPELGAPPWLFLQAPMNVQLGGPAVAIVGARRATFDGLRTAGDLARLLARSSVTVVSGMARGIDQAAHRGALDAGGRTVAVLGAGFGVDYPAKDGALRGAVAASGGLVTEHVPGVGPKPIHFLWRNRVISGLAEATVVVEGGARSGALRTARLAAAQGREVFAVPGSINLPTSQAPLALMRDGAQPLTRLADVLDALPAARPPGGLAAHSSASQHPVTAPLDPVAAAVLDLLSATPCSPGRLATACQAPVSAVLAAIATLTQAGLARTTPRGVVAGSAQGAKR